MKTWFVVVSGVQIWLQGSRSMELRSGWGRNSQCGRSTYVMV